ncbi:MAG TPA: TetR/AcrR family transcriptional regulator [Candidatus Omnitrophota bacterium]|nr:TetR/AcrR family transcriptional regulator [Candidatus Omnitrophota bacterium]
MALRKSRDERRLEIIEANMRLAAKLGPDRITAEAIAQDLGVTQPAIFRHFPRKDDIWTATVEWLADSLGTLWGEAMAGAPPEERLTALVEAHLGFIEAHPAVPLVLLSPELQARHASVRQATARMMGLFHAQLSRALDDGRQAGAFDSGLDVARAAWMMIALIQGIAIRWTASQGRFDIRAEGLALIGMAVRGIVR